MASEAQRVGVRKCRYQKPMKSWGQLHFKCATLPCSAAFQVMLSTLRLTSIVKSQEKIILKNFNEKRILKRIDFSYELVRNT